MQVLTEQEMDQVQGGFGPAGALVGGVIGAVSQGSAAYITGQGMRGAMTAAAIGAAIGAIAGGTGGMSVIATAVRGVQVSTIAAGAQVLAGGPQKKLRTETSQ
jgi:lactobin A/cerein 7B family class IIb bacteriocin